MMGMMMMWSTWWISLLCVSGLMDVIHTSNGDSRNGNALSALQSLRGGGGGRFSGQEDTVPLRLLYNRPGQTQTQSQVQTQTPRDELTTRIRASGPSSAQVNHVAQASFQVDAFGRKFILDVELNHDLLSSKYVERHLSENGKAVITKGGEHCYYQGKVRNVPDSFVALSTCHGLHGMFFDGNHTYMIEPGGQTSTSGDVQIHLIYKSAGQEGLVDLLNGDLPEPPFPSPPFPGSRIQRRKKRQAPRERRSVEEETKYIELMVINDHLMYKKHRLSVGQTNNYAKSVVNMADMSSINFNTSTRTKHRTWGDRAFSIAAPSLWNSLPKPIRDCTNINNFKTQLKTHLFKLAFNDKTSVWMEVAL
ncbi:Disintegrin and metalloproteinase domain-containing protein 22 [Merluccius polli]|uniref:Disintegrin and metalloproteinase domain-containing protein 22 n=1 Tax=Merluccius polli TaxID=89951 RepID=A0AA47MXE9_MERPO|nr:Disintegrin and metalloproteinase domain-containing protein 22 [Merluccius polli]